ncbi:hypothetical protein [Roseibium sp.]|uniref:hypothetical protein n=1 Tax=Roseibium sp. TaxID=1936156 RepID=UPI0032968609
MIKKLTCATALFVLGACNYSDITHINNRFVAKYEYNGTKYDVYQAIQVDEGGLSIGGSSQQTQTRVFRLFPEGADPQTDSSTTGEFLGTDNQITTCSGNLSECKIAFGKALDKLQTEDEPTSEGGGMY